MENLTDEMKELLRKISTLCYEAGEEVYDCKETNGILNLCDELSEKIDEVLGL